MTESGWRGSQLDDAVDDSDDVDRDSNDGADIKNNTPHTKIPAVAIPEMTSDTENCKA